MTRLSEPFETVPGITGRVVNGEGVTVGFFTLAPNCVLPEHHHPQAQITTVTSGEIAMTVDGSTRTLRPGDCAVIPPNAPHSATSEHGAEVVDVFHPERVWG